MTADSPRDYSPEAEGVRDCCANLAMVIRESAVAARKGALALNQIDVREGLNLLANDCEAWASRLERAVQKLDAEHVWLVKWVCPQCRHEHAGMTCTLCGCEQTMERTLEDEKASLRP